MNDNELEISIQKLMDVDLHELGKAIFEARQATNLRRDDRTLESVKSALEGLAEDANHVVIIAKESSQQQVVGSIILYAGFPLMVFSSGWDLVTHPSIDADVVVSKLVQSGKSYVEEIGKERFEFEFDAITTDHEGLLKAYDKRLLANGMYKAAEEFHMYLDLEPNMRYDAILPEDIVLVGMFSIDRDALVKQFFDVFGDSKDELWIDMTKEQQTVSCNYWFDRNRPLVEEASYIALKDDKVVGVHIARPDGETVDVGPVGIHPNYRRQGLATALFRKSLNVLVSQGYKRVTLDVAVENTPAYTMYENLGFKKMHKKAFYVWRVQR